VPQRIDALIRPKWTLLVEPGARTESGLALAVDKGVIVNVLPADEALHRYTPDALHDRPGHVALPGLINAHCHAGMTLFRGYADDLPLRRWLDERIWPAESRWISPEFVADGTRLAIAEMLLGGTTCFSDMYYYPDVVAETAVQCGIRAAVGMIALEFPTAWARDPDEYIRKGLAVHDRYKNDALVATTFAPHAPYSVSDATLRRIRRLADELDVPVHMHVHETAAEIAEAVEASGRRPLARLEALGLLTPGLLAVHATQLGGEEIDALARARASIVHCPRSNLKLASGACPVQALADAGVNLALGTDGAASNNRLDMLSEMQFAALLGKHVANSATAVPAAAALEMATINGARALNLDGRTGSLAAGKAADIVCISLSALNQQPVLDALSALVYSSARSQVTDVWVAGEHLVDGGELTRIDKEELIAVARRWADRLTAQ
jgi:5-methylthioadenosine/S-adenosylhomocysteine deaminase